MLVSLFMVKMDTLHVFPHASNLPCDLTAGVLFVFRNLTNVRKQKLPIQKQPLQASHLLQLQILNGGMICTPLDPMEKIMEMKISTWRNWVGLFQKVQALLLV